MSTRSRIGAHPPVAATRQQLSQREIEGVLQQYQTGAVRNIRELPAGSLYSPKVILETERGTLLLKRRARGLDMPALVAFGHEVMLGCQTHGLCVPPLIGTKEDNSSFVQFSDHVYELFVFIEGTAFEYANPNHAYAMGSLLVETHNAMDQVRTTFPSAAEPEAIDLTRLNALQSIEHLLPPKLSHDVPRILGYGHELAQANASTPALVHGDWHPGNMIFRGDELVAICDFDNTRVGSRLRELAQSMVHVSMVAPNQGQRGADVPAEPDAVRLMSFWNGYRESGGTVPPRTAIGLMPGVMLDEALAALGSNPNEQHGSMLTAIWRKAAWIDENLSRLVDRLNG